MKYDGYADDERELEVIDLDEVRRGRAASEWRDRLLYRAKGAIDPCVANAITILANDPAWRGVIARDAFAFEIVTTRPPPWERDDVQTTPIAGPWSDADSVRAGAWLHRKWSLRLPRESVLDAVGVVAERNIVHPVRDFLDALEWDGVQRVGAWLSTYLGAQPTTYTSRVGEWFLISAIARIYSPGAKVDTLPVFEGAQGLRKSSALRALFSPAWFSDTPLDLESKDRFVGLRSRWGIELAELDSVNRSGVDRIKSFLSSATDSYRPPYGRSIVTVPRQCVFAGTVNGDTYLKDETGNRRFWPVRVGTIDVDGISRDRAQLWAEAREMYRGRARWWPQGDEVRLCADEQRDRVQADAWLDRVSEWVARKPTGATVTVSEVLTDALRIELGRWTQIDQNRVARCLKLLGYERKQIRVEGARVWAYARPVTTSPDVHRSEDT